MMAEMGRCRDCHWWDQAEIQPPAFPRTGRCLKLRRGDGPLKNGMAYPMIGGRDFAFILTDQDFGCIQFEAKRG